MAPGIGNKRMQHLRALRVARKLKREALAKGGGENYLPKEQLARVDVTEEEPEKASGSDSDSEGSEDSKTADSGEQEPVQANTSAFDTLIASSKKHGAFDSTTFEYQRGPEPSKKTLFRKPRELRKAAENTPTLHTFFSTVSGQPATPASPTLSTDERKQLKVSTVQAPDPVSTFSFELINRYFYPCRRVLPKALDSVSPASISRYFHHCERLIEASGWSWRGLWNKGICGVGPSASC